MVDAEEEEKKGKKDICGLKKLCRRDRKIERERIALCTRTVLHQ